VTATTLGLESTGVRTCTISLAPFEMKKTNDGSISNRGEKKNCRDPVNSHEIGLTTTAADEWNSINRQSHNTTSYGNRTTSDCDVGEQLGNHPLPILEKERRKKERNAQRQIKKDGRHTSI
jgi:hypothetical protein